VIDNSDKPKAGMTIDPVGLLPPGLAAKREFGRRVNAYVLKHVHGLEDLAPIGKHLVEVGGVDPVAAADMLFDAFSEGRMWDALGGYGECRAAIWAAVGRPMRQRTFEEILGR
jgi:hypothetical protein